MTFIGSFFSNPSELEQFELKTTPDDINNHLLAIQHHLLLTELRRHEIMNLALATATYEAKAKLDPQMARNVGSQLRQILDEVGIHDSYCHKIPILPKIDHPN